jgi:hypothetical protein
LGEAVPASANPHGIYFEPVPSCGHTAVKRRKYVRPALANGTTAGNRDQSNSLIFLEIIHSLGCQIGNIFFFKPIYCLLTEQIFYSRD